MNEFLSSPTVREFWHVVVAALLGLFIGLERERSRDTANGEDGPFAGIRTFAIVCVTGYAAAILGSRIHPTVFVVGFAIAGGFAGLSHWLARETKPGTTTEIAFVLTYLLGGLVFVDELLLASVLALLVTAMLANKPALHQFAHSVTRDDILSALEFGAITLVVLPLLPNRTVDPLDAVNPRNVWLMVVLVSGVGFSGYVLVKLFGARAGLEVTGILGGLVSSTAATLTFARRATEGRTIVRSLGLAMLLASLVLYPRVVAIAAVVNRGFAAALALPLAVVGAVAFACMLLVWRQAREELSEESPAPGFRNPFELFPAIRFGILFAVVLVVVRLAQQHLGETGMYVASFASGLVSMDAVTLSLARMDAQGGVERHAAVAALLLACVANTFVRAVIVWMTGIAVLRRSAGLALLVATAATLAAFVAAAAGFLA
jgi:uncharacterized membrane protein (DUF4010 family)